MFESLAADSKLSELYARAWEEVKDPSRIWVRRSWSYGDHLEVARGIILGGALSPLYLAASSQLGSPPVGQTAPLCYHMNRGRILPVETISGTLADWVPILQEAAKTGESLLVVTKAIESADVLGAMITNAEKNVVSCCPISPGACDLNLLMPSRSVFSRRPASIRDYSDLSKLHPVNEVIVRRSASLVLVEPGHALSHLATDISVISVGGTHVENQDDRLKLACFELDRLESKDQR